jgi:phospholipase/carboxylesterase
MSQNQTAINPLTEHSITAEVKLYYDLYVPEKAAKPSPLLISVHGYGASKRYMMREGRAIAPENFAIATPQGYHQHFREPRDGQTEYRIGFSWLTNYKAEESVAVHHKFINDIIENLIERGIADQEKIFLLGFSQACALNFRFAFTYPNILRGVVGICGGIPSDWETNQVYQSTDADVCYLYADTDEFYPLEKFRENSEKLNSRAPNFQAKCYSAKHEITDEMRRDINEWLKLLS